MRSTTYHFGVGYEVWNAQDSWFWLVISPYRNAGTIGAAGSRNQAARDACLAIEEMAAWGYQLSSTVSSGEPRFDSSDAIAQAKIEWDAILTRLQHYLSLGLVTSSSA
jgi:hypothetical protein